MKYDVIVVGGGPAGLAAAVEASKNGAEKVLVVERDQELGGILNQCIHNGFGLHYFKEELTGPEYAGKFIDMLNETNIEVMLDTMVLDVDETEKCVHAMNKKNGYMKLEGRSIILNMGCRERTRGAIAIPGDRPAGVFTAGAAKQTIDLNSKEYDMSQNKEYIEDLFSAQKVKKWKKLTLLEKRERLEYIIKNQCVKLGMETVPPLILSETQDSDSETATIVAQYSKTEDCIRINLDYVNNYPRTSMSALCHEMRHRYQVMQVSLYDQLKKDKKYKDYMNMEMFEDIKTYKKEIKNYKTDYTDSQEEYRQQEVEKDANEYAGHQMSEYLRFLVK